MTSSIKKIYIDPSYKDYYQDGLFDISNPKLNRDDSLQPLHRLQKALNGIGTEIHTADYLPEFAQDNIAISYYSLGLMDKYHELSTRPDVKLRAFIIMEPPAVAPHLYRELPELTRHFERVYVHNTQGDGYSLKHVDQSRLRTFYWPQPCNGPIEPYWSNKSRLHRIVVINGNHIPRSLRGQLYGKRIAAMAELHNTRLVDLYGRGWDQWWSHRSMWPPYWFNYKKLMSIYRGPCDSKYEVLGQYNFSLCFENMTMTGYVTEKIFDCLYAGCIPLYLGAKNIEDLIPPATYIDCRQFSSWTEMGEYVLAMSADEIATIKAAGRAFLESTAYLKYYDSLMNIVNE
jgi:alpha(1,3/1,4) fucosyltransferase